MIELAYPLIVEGKYDRLRVMTVARGNIIMTDGFGIFRKNEQKCLLMTLARATPVIVLCDSDGAGTVIRSHISSILPPEKVINLYIPRIEGTEKRKKQPSKEGTLGVEGMESELLARLLEPFSIENIGHGNASASARAENPLCKADFYADGFSGREDSEKMRDLLAARFELPPHMSANALLSAIRIVASYDEYKKAAGEVNGGK